MPAPVALQASSDLFRCCPWALSRPVCLSVLIRPETQTVQPFGASHLQLPHREFQTSANFRDIDTTAQLIGAGAATVGVAGSGAGSGTALGNLDTNPSKKEQLSSYSMVEVALLGAMGHVTLEIAFLILFAM